MTRTVYARNEDIALFSAKARSGEIGDDAVVPLAVVFAACRKAQIAIGPGHFPLDALLDALPAAYVENCLKKRKRHH